MMGISKGFFSRIRNKVGTGMVITAMFPLLMATYLSYSLSHDLIIEKVKESLQLDIKGHVDDINAKLKSSKDVVKILSKMPPIQGIIRAKKNKNIDALDGSTEQLWNNRLASIFAEYIKSEEKYLQIRFIDENGQELVRVDRKDGKPNIKTENELQNKADRYYFQSTIQMPKNEVFVSPLDLNREGSPPEIERPVKPVVRYGTAIFDEVTNEPKGILIINIDGENILRDIHSGEKEKVTKENELEEEFIVDMDGYYLVNPNKNKEWGSSRDLNTGENIKNDLPEEIYSQILSEKEGVIDIDGGAYIIGHGKIYPNDEEQSNFWTMYEVVPRDFVLEPAIKNRNILLMGMVFFVIIAIGFASILSGSISNPITDLTKVAEQIGMGNLEQRATIISSDEIGFLGETINKMADKVLEERLTLQTTVKERTKNIEEQKEKLEEQQTAILNVLEDIDNQKKISLKNAEELKKYKMAVDSTSDHIVITDAEGIVLYANKAVSNITGYKAEEVIGKKAGTKDTWGGLMGQEVYEDLWRTIKTEKRTYVGEVINKRKNGERYYAKSTISPVLNDNGEVQFFIGIERDITKEKNVDMMKTDFISLASHQLRTPLSGIKWLLEILIGEKRGELNESQKEVVNDMNVANERMIKLVGSLLNVSHLETGKIQIDMKPTDIGELITDVVKELKPAFDKKQILVETIGTYKKIMANVDAKLCHEAYTNLLSNAMKYTNSGGKVIIELSEDEENIITRVKDNGAGIPEKDKDKIFGKFFRADNIRKDSTEGSGLGLYLVKLIIDAFKGKISFESKEGKGTTFTVTIPKK